jgi:uncharacterized radical SAM superfamily Fe-S cluster-containing enzyme
MAPNVRPYQFYDTAVSICSTCYRRVDAKIVFCDGAVWMLKRCGEHGAERVLIADDIDYYRRCREVFIKAPEQVARYNTPVRWGCPYDCGICPDHEQHGCNLLIEVTDACNLRCPTCYAMSAPERTTHRSLEQIERMLDRACANEVEPDIVQISGGEPTIHPQFWQILDAAKKRPIKHLMLNTNGIKIAEEEGFAERLKEYQPDFEVYLQFDSFRRQPLMMLRAADLRGVHERALEKLNALDIDTTLVMTVRRGVNEQEIGAVVDYALEQPCVRGVTIQPVQAAGRLEKYDGGFDVGRDRLTLTEVRRMVLEQCDVFAPEDVIPVPCHADSIAMAYALKLDGNIIPLTGLVDPELLIEGGRNTIAYEKEETVKDALFHLFSTHHSVSSQTTAMDQFLSASSDSDEIAYKNIFRLLIIEFIDAHAFDLRSIRKTCVHIVHPDGERVIPFDTYNLLYRDDLEKTVLAPLRAERRIIKGPLSVHKRQDAAE